MRRRVGNSEFVYVVFTSNIQNEMQTKDRRLKLIRKFFAVTAAAFMLMVGSQMASAAVSAPEAASKAPVTAATTDGSYKVAQNNRRARNRGNRGNRRRGNRGRNVGIGLGLGLGALALGAGIAASRDRGAHRSCRRVERRCANRHGWETRRWYHCVEDRGC